MANDILAGLFESGVLNEEVSSQIKEALEAKINEAREEVTAELREEFAQKFEHDKTVIVEAMGHTIESAIRKEIEEFQADRASLISERVAYKRAIAEHAKILESFITSRLASEVKELRADRAKMNEHLETTKVFVTKKLSQELAEFHNDKRALVETKVRMVSEGKELIAKTRKDFIKRSAGLVENTIKTALRSELGALKEDIKQAKENDFGRRLFEAFSGEFMASQLNEGTEVSKLNKKLNENTKALAKLEKVLAEKDQQVADAAKKVRIMEDRATRKAAMATLLSPLTGQKRKVMSDLLESVKTANLEAAFKKHLPYVLNESVDVKSGRQQLSEGKVTEKTGNRIVESNGNFSGGNTDDNIIQLKKLAGLN